jgi:hypothetical protein
MPEVATSTSIFAIQANLHKLSLAAKNLNELSDKLTAEVSEIEDTINKLNLGITAYVVFEAWSDDTGLERGAWRLEYGKLMGKWGFIINYSTEDLGRGPDNEFTENWLFKDSPREKRLRAVEKIPELLAALVKKSDEVATELNTRVKYVQDLATSFSFSQDGSKK